MKRTTPYAAPRPIASLGLDKEAEDRLLKSYPRQIAMMGDDKIIALLAGSQATVFEAPLRWWPL